MLDLQTSEFVNTSVLASYLGVSKMTITRMRRTGRLPLPCYVDGGTTLWATADLIEWERCGRPINVAFAIDAGETLCRNADRAIQEDRTIAPDSFRRGDRDIAEAPAQLREMIADMRRAADLCERVLNSCAGFVKQADSLSLEARERIGRLPEKS